MTKAFKFIKERMQDPEFNRRFTEAVLADRNKEINKEDEAAYNYIQEKYPTVADLPFKLPEDFRDM